MISEKRWCEAGECMNAPTAKVIIYDDKNNEFYVNTTFCSEHAQQLADFINAFKGDER